MRIGCSGISAVCVNKLHRTLVSPSAKWTFIADYLTDCSEVRVEKKFIKVVFVFVLNNWEHSSVR